jgi:hypothetical protein
MMSTSSSNVKELGPQILRWKRNIVQELQNSLLVCTSAPVLGSSCMHTIFDTGVEPHVCLFHDVEETHTPLQFPGMSRFIVL